MIIEATRVLVALSYVILTYVIYRSIPVIAPAERPARRFLTAAVAMWAGWYIYLAITRTPFEQPWLVLRNVLHIPLVVAIGFTIWARRRNVR